MSPADARYRHSVLWELRHTWLRLEIAQTDIGGASVALGEGYLGPEAALEVLEDAKAGLVTDVESGR